MALGFPDRGLQEHSDFTGFNWSNVPVILVEMGFMTNPAEDRALATDAGATGLRSGCAAARSASGARRWSLPGLMRHYLGKPKFLGTMDV